MKKITTLLLVLCSVIALRAQTSLYFDTQYFTGCAAVTNTATPMINTVPGFYPSDSVLPCMNAGQYGYDTIYLKNYTTFSIATVNSLKIDSIYAPAGVCWSTNKANNTFAGGEDGVIVLSGVPTASAGTYKLRIVVDVNTTIGNFASIDLEALAHLRYHVRVACSNSGCPAVNAADTISVFSADTAACGVLVANITASGPTTLCAGDSVTLTANSGPGYTYTWSTGATTRAITVGTSGSYTVTVSHNNVNATAAPVQVTVSATCAPDATISPAGPITICNGTVQALSAPGHTGYQYLWSTGQTTQSIAVTASGAYTVTVSYNGATATNTVYVTSTACAVTYWNPTYFFDCETATNQIAPHMSTVPGLAPSDSALPCLPSGVLGSDTIYFTNFTTLSVATINSVKFDSIYLPAGLCWSTNKVNNTFSGGENGVILISGTPTAPAGSYKLRIIADVNTSIGSFNSVDVEALAHLRYHVRVSCPSYSCPALNTADSISLYVPDNSSCSTPPLVATITAQGPTTFCDGGSVALATDYDPSYSYQWSDGATSYSTIAYTSGSYTVTVTQNGNSVTATPVSVTVNPLPTAAFSLVQNPGAAHAWTVVNQCTGSNLAYTWSWGDYSGTNAGATPTHTYDSAGYYTICVGVSDQNGCQASYCDSNAYLYKTDAEMVSLTVVQYTLGTTDVNARQLTMSYYGGAVHFSETIAEPSDVTLYDMSGRIVMSRKAWTGSVLTTDGALADGVYIVALQNNTQRLSGRIGIVK